MNIAEITAAVANWTRLQDSARDVFWHIYYLRADWQGQTVGRPYDLQFDFGDEVVSVTGEARACNRGCCGTELGSWEFPTEYLTLEDLDEVTVRMAADLPPSKAET